MLTIPVQARVNIIKIREAVIGPSWNQNHWESISHNYFKAKYFCKYRELFENLYLGCQENRLSQKLSLYKEIKIQNLIS